jgi:hypothetical protein
MQTFRTTDIRGDTMIEHHFMLNIDRASSVEPQVRMWIDDQQTSNLFSEREVTLVRETVSSWSARFIADGPFTYRIGIVAVPGSRWSLAFRTVGADPQELHYDSDELTMPKEWLIGTCEESEADADAPRATMDGTLSLIPLGS